MKAQRPYKGLARYRHEDHLLFAGRDTEIRSCLGLLRGSQNLFILHGNSGCGKSSFLEAGLLPTLDLEATNGFSRLVPVRKNPNTAPFVIRLEKEPLKAIAVGLHAICTQLETQLNSKILDGQSEMDFTDLNADGLLDVLGQISLSCAPADTKPLIVLDQAESIFENFDEHCDSINEYFDFLAQITVIPLYIKFLLSLRTDFKGRFDDQLLRHSADHVQIATYFLDEISESGIIEAILQPTRLPEYQISYEEDVPGMILKDLWEIRGKWPILPVLQVICDRLSTHAASPEGTKITEDDYRCTGASSAQIASHIEESIVGYFVEHKLSQKIDVVEQVDLWENLLTRMVDVDVDGRTRARRAVSLDEMETAARDGGYVPSVVEMFRWLGSESQYILEELRSDSNGVGGNSWRLMHDSVGVALRALRPIRSVGRGNLASASLSRAPETLTVSDLYGADAPTSCVFTTINDLIWDHLIPIYAQRRGFTSRLGIELNVNPRFDLPRYHGAVNYYSEFFASAKDSSNRYLAVLPGKVFPQILDEPWITVGIPNIYRGYAVVGRKDHDLSPLHRQVGSNLPSPQEKWNRLRGLAAVLSDPQTRILSYEGEGADFVNCILKLCGRDLRTDISIVTENSSGRFQGTQDPMFRALVTNSYHFVLGPAPSRALAEQAGFEVYADFEEVYELASVDHEGLDSEEVTSLMDGLLLHENWVVNIPVSENDPVLMRLASVLFYTVNFIRENPNDFVAFLSNAVYASCERGAYSLQRDFIARTVSRCYEYIAPNLHPFTYFSPASRYHFPVTGQYAPNTVYCSWSMWRTRCDELLMSMVNRWPLAWPIDAQASFRRAEYHSSIFNYYDAFAQLSETKRILEANTNGVGMETTNATT